MAQTFAVIVGIDFSIKEPNRNSDSEMGLGAAFMSNERAWHKTATNGIYPINKAATKEKKEQNKVFQNNCSRELNLFPIRKVAMTQ